MTATEWGIIIGGFTSVILGIVAMSNCAKGLTEKTHTRIFERIDEVKATGKKEFVIKELCDEKHKRTDELLDRISKTVDKILEKVNGV